MLRNPKTHYVTIFVFQFTITLCLNLYAFGLNTPPPAETATADAWMYVVYAQNLATGNGYTWNGRPTAFRMPGTSFFLAPIFWLGGHENYAAGRVAYCVLAGFTACLFYALLANFVPSGTAFVGAVGFAVLPEYFVWSATFLSEPIFVALLVLFLWNIRRSEENSSRVTYFLAGAALGAATLVKAIGTSILVFYVASRYLLGRRIAFSHLGALVLGFSLLLAPWLARNYVLFGHFLLANNSGSTFWGANNEVIIRDPRRIGHWISTTELPGRTLVDAQPSEYLHDQKEWELGRAFVGANVNEMPRLLSWKFYRLLSPLRENEHTLLKVALFSSWSVLFPLSLLGLALPGRCQRLGELRSALYACLAALALQTAVFYGSVRFRGAFAPAFVFLAVVGMHQILAGRRQHSANEP